MKLNLRRHRIEKVCADEKRPTIAQPWLDVDNNVLVATDSYALAVVPVDISLTDTAGPIPILALEAARKKSKDHIADIACDGTVDVPDARAKYDRPSVDGDDGHGFPDWQTIVARDGTPRVTIGVNARILLNLAQALGTEQVELAVYEQNERISVRPIGRDGQGIIMPISRGE